MKKLLLLIFLLSFSIGKSQNKILNGTFAAGTANWGFGSPGVVASGEAYYSTANAAGNSYDTELKQVSLSFTNATTYTLIFRARAAANRNISVNIQNTGIWSDQFRNNAVALTTTMTTYTYVFNATSTNNNAQLNFHMANMGANTTAAVYIDDVAIMPGDVSATPCSNGIQDAALGETGVDCGGTCSACLITPTFNAFTVGPKLVGDAPFVVTASSDSSGAITYTSSNTGVATITGNTITIVGAGTSTITANQAADAGYYAGSTTAVLSVTPPAAPAPPARNTWDVTSLYSDSYTTSSSASWGVGTGVSISGNNTRLLSGSPTYRLPFTATNVSAMTTLHIDVYALNQSSWQFRLNDKAVTKSTPVNGWTSIDILLSEYASQSLNLTNVSFFDFFNPNGANPNTSYVDNIYFYRAATDTPPTIGALTVPSPKVFGDAPFTLTDPTSNSSGAWTYSSSPAGVITISGNTVTIVGGGTTTITATQAAVPSVYGPGTTSASLVVNYPAPGASPIPPARDPSCVVSLYTGNPTTYANVRTAGQASWSTGSTSSNFSFTNGSDTCIQVNNLGFFGLVGNTNFSVAGMTKLHVDIYVNTPMTTMILNLLAPADRNYSIGPLTTGWNSFDIPLTNYPGALTDIAGIKFEQSGGTARQIYIDNVYFYAGGAPTITNFPAIGKVNGEAPFTLTNPTSDSAGTWTYTSSNESVATVSGNTVTIVGQGTSTITATQATNGCFSIGSLQATLTVAASSVPLAGPTVPPTRNAWDAFSVFSDAAYPLIAGTRNYNPGWGQAGTGAIVTAGTDNVWRASNLNYQGIQFGSNADVSAMTHFHVDVWTFNETSLQFFQISNTTGERSVALAAPYGALTQGSWISYDIPLTAWTSQSGFTTTALKEFKIVGSGGKTVYMDNMYFYRAATTEPPTLGTFTVPAKLIGDAAFTLTPPTSNSAGAFTYTSSNTAVATISGDTVTIVGAGSSTITATQAANGSYGAGTKTAILTVSFPLPTTGAPSQPARNAWDVVSLYSGDYTATAGAGWQNGADVSLSGNNARFFNGFTLARLAFTPVNLTTAGMTHLHLSVYTHNQNQLWFEIQGNRRVESSIALNGWVEFNIPLSEYTGLNLANISFFDLNNPTGAADPVKVVYMDDVYFYRPATAEPPTIGTFTVPAKVIGDAAFTLTAPTSNSAGAFTYTSSNTAVATISGNTVTIVGVGSSTITATQAANGVYGQGSKTATLSVTPPSAPTPPARNSSNVVSLYSDSYTPTNGATWQAGVDVLTSVGNNARYFNDFTLARLTFAARSVTGMTTLHIDVYTLNQNQLWFEINGNRKVVSSIPLNGWASFDIPLTDYVGLNLGNVSFFDLNNPTGAAAPVKIVYLDNIYFYKQDTWLGTTSTNWATATNWASGAAPTATSDVVIASSATQPIIGSDVSISSLTVNSGASLIVNSGFNLTVANAVANSGTMTLENNANLIQGGTTNTNTGSISVERDSASILRLDHTLWSSPVASQNLYDFSPETLTNRFYTYNTTSNSYVTTGLSAATTFAAGKGYAVRAPNDHSSSTPTIWEGTFTGVPNNGTVPFTLDTNGIGFNLVGNPYPSPITATSFLTENSSKIGGTLYFYAHSLPMNADGTFPTGTNYSAWNSGTGGVAATRADIGIPHNISVPVAPNGIIQAGQGFFVKATAPGTINFTNAMRIANNANQFFRTTEIERHRLWLNLTTESGTDINQIAVAYVEGATQNADTNFDGLSFGNTGSMLSSKINGSDYVIQGRSLPFVSNDIVPLGFKTSTAGNYKIVLTNKDGLFLGNQDVFVRDNLMGIEHNIKVSPYVFTSAAGTFDARFQLVYTQALGTPSSSFSPNSVLVYKNTDGFHVTTNGIMMKDILVYDISGRLIFKQTNINGTSTHLKGLSQIKQVLLLKITSQENETVTVKAIN